MDDWLVLTKSKTMLRKIIKKTHTILNELHFDMHPHKTYMGRIDKGFNFLGYFYQPSTLLPSLESLRRFHERSLARYAQPNVPHRHCPPKRDVSDYKVNERPPTDEDMIRILSSIHWGRCSTPDGARGMQRYLQRWGNWFKAGLKDIHGFISAVQHLLPSLWGVMDAQPLDAIFLAAVN